MRHFAVQTNGTVSKQYTRQQCQRFADVCERAAAAAIALAAKTMSQIGLAETFAEDLTKTAGELKQTAQAWKHDAHVLQAAALQPDRTASRPVAAYRPPVFQYDLTSARLDLTELAAA